jgi:hypothetical protein
MHDLPGRQLWGRGVATTAGTGRFNAAALRSFPVLGAAVALLLLNLSDGLFTLTFLQLGLAEELNPLMRVAYERSPLLFMAFKLAIVGTGVALLCAHHEHRVARWALSGGFVLYALINLYHLAFLAHSLAIGLR